MYLGMYFNLQRFTSPPTRITQATRSTQTLVSTARWRTGPPRSSFSTHHNVARRSVPRTSALEACGLKKTTTRGGTLVQAGSGS